MNRLGAPPLFSRSRIGQAFRWFRILDAHVVAVAVLAVIATWLAIRFGIRARLPSEVIATAVVFPIVFSINASYKRREDALRNLAAVRANLGSIFLAHRDLPTSDGEMHGRRGKGLCQAFYEAVCTAVCSPGPCPPDAAKAVVTGASDLSRSITQLRDAGVPPNEVSRTNGHLNGALVAYESLKAVLQYRTPKALRLHNKLFLNLFPILYAPLYAEIAFEGGQAFAYVMAVAYAVVLVGLDNIQAWLEHPFDSIGDDDIRIDPTEDVVWLSDTFDGDPAGERSPSP